LGHRNLLFSGHLASPNPDTDIACTNGNGINRLASAGIPLQALSAVVGRGGILRPIASGTYLVNEKMLADLRSPRESER